MGSTTIQFTNGLCVNVSYWNVHVASLERRTEVGSTTPG